METVNELKITVEATVLAPLDKVWNYWTEPEHILQWNNAPDDWHTPRAENDLKAGGTFLYRMEARDGSFGFDFGGVYDEVEPGSLISYTLGDGRKVKITFELKDGATHIVETFDAEAAHSAEMQKNGWQAILNNFKGHVEKE